MRFLARLRSAVVVLVVAGCAALLPATSASADPAGDLATFPVMLVGLSSSTATSATICAKGYVDDGFPSVSRWVFHGAGSTTFWSDDRTGPTYATTCRAVHTNGMPVGAAEASLSYVGVGGDIIGHCAGTVSWAPGFPINWLAGLCTGMA